MKPPLKTLETNQKPWKTKKWWFFGQTDTHHNIYIITRPKPAYGQQGLAGSSLHASGAQLGSGKWWFFVTNRHFIIINISSLSPLPPDLWHGANSLGEGKSALTGHVDHLLKRETPAISSWHWPSRQLFVFLFNNNNIWHQLISTSTGNPT